MLLIPLFENLVACPPMVLKFAKNRFRAPPDEISEILRSPKSDFVPPPMRAPLLQKSISCPPRWSFFVPLRISEMKFVPLFSCPCFCHFFVPLFPPLGICAKMPEKACFFVPLFSCPSFDPFFVPLSGFGQISKCLDFVPLFSCP